MAGIAGPPDDVEPMPSAGAAEASLAAEVREAYMREFRRHRAAIGKESDSYGRRPIARWDGGRDANGATHKPVWPKIANKLRFARLESETDVYVRAQFAYGKPPRPNQLIAASAMDRYQDFVRTAEDNAPALLRSDLVTFESAVRTAQSWFPEKTPKESWRYVLLSGQWQLCPLFRFCLCVQEGMRELAEEYEEEALRQYMPASAAYDLHWQSLVPRRLQLAAKARRDLLAGGRR